MNVLIDISKTLLKVRISGQKSLDYDGIVN
jgi:hypothetical protein